MIHGYGHISEWENFQSNSNSSPVPILDSIDHRNISIVLTTICQSQINVCIDIPIFCTAPIRFNVDKLSIFSKIVHYKRFEIKEVKFSIGMHFVFLN